MEAIPTGSSERPDPGETERRRRYANLVVPEVPVLLRVAMTLTKQPADAEDLVQETLLRAWRSLDAFDGQHPRAWLLTVLRNAEINRHRRRRPQLLDDPDEPGERHLRIATPSAEQQVLDRAFDAVVEAALLELPRAMREVVVLVDIDGLTYTEAATALGVPEGTVTSRLHRGRRRVRARLHDAGLAPRRYL